MTVVASEFLSRFSEFDGFKSEDIIQALLTESALFFADPEWGEQPLRDLATQLLTAHNLELQRQTILDTGDRLYYQREAVNKDVILPDVELYHQTRYGLQLLDLINNNILGTIFL